MTTSEILNVEHVKQQIDYVKHMTTLSTGSILLLATFLEKLFSKPLWKPFVVAAFCGFLISVISAVLAHTLLVGDRTFFEHPDPLDGPQVFTLLVAICVMWLGFLVGVTALAAFAIRNLL